MQEMNDTLKTVRDVIYRWITPIFDKNTYADALHFDRIRDNQFVWVFKKSDHETYEKCVGVMKISSKDELYEIYQYFFDMYHVNITIRNGKVKWYDKLPTEFCDFTYDQMYSLYEMLCNAFNQVDG